MQNLSSTATVIEVTLLHEEAEEEDEEEDEDEESVKISIFTCISYLVTFSSNFLHAVTFLLVLHLDVLRGPPMAIPIYTVLPYCVI